MSRSRWCLNTLFVLMPIAVQVGTSADSVTTVTMPNGTRFEVAGGVGEYAFITRGCESVVNRRHVSYREVGGALEQGVGGGVSLGVRGGWMRDDLEGVDDPAFAEPIPGQQIENHYANPYVTFERPSGSVGLGWVWHDKEFITAGEQARTEPDHPLNDISAHMRIGSERRYFAIRWMEGVPLYSSGGYLTIGAGGHPGGGPLSLYGGLGAGGPFEGAGLMLQGSYEFGSGITTSVRTRLGYSGDANASGISVGLGYRAIRP